jgi:hypothetical protein
MHRVGVCGEQAELLRFLDRAIMRALMGRWCVSTSQRRRGLSVIAS